MQNIVLESDSQILVKALRTREQYQAMGGVLFREAKFIMPTMFVSVSVLHVSHSCNSAARSCKSAAHELASLG